MFLKDEGISVIDDSEIVKKILKHLRLWNQKARPPPNANAPPKAQKYPIEDTNSEVPVPDNWLYVHPQYPDINAV
jgi:hypothetical protein